MTVVTLPAGEGRMQLQVGDVIDVRAASGITSGNLMATKIVVHDPSDSSRTSSIYTPMYELNLPAIVVAGIPFVTTGSTAFVAGGQPIDSYKFFGRSWYVRCFKTSQNYSTLHLTLDRNGNGEWLVTEVEVQRAPCPD